MVDEDRTRTRGRHVELSGRILGARLRSRVLLADHLELEITLRIHGQCNIFTIPHFCRSGGHLLRLSRSGGVSRWPVRFEQIQPRRAVTNHSQNAPERPA